MRISKIQHGRPSRDFGVGRKCAYPGCEHILSRYNPDNICGSHSLFLPVENMMEYPEEMKICSCCGELKPATVEFFRRRHSRLEAQCKTCVNVKRRERKEAKIEEDGQRRCEVCGKIRPRDVDNFRHDDESPDGFSRTCVFCVREKWKQAARESRKRRAVRVKEGGHGSYVAR